MASRKDYNALAEVLNELEHYDIEAGRKVREVIAVKMAKIFAADNEAFDEQRFYEACDLDLYFAVQQADYFDAELQGELEVTA